MPDTTTIYITKGAETHGIRKVEACRIDGDGWAAVRISHVPGYEQTYLFNPREWYREFSQAQANAKTRIEKRIKLLRAKLAAMEAIDLTKVREG